MRIRTELLFSLLAFTLAAGCTVVNDFGQYTFAGDAGPSDPCANRAMDGEETDVDCGGTICMTCSLGGSCNADTDCESGFCRDGNSCATPTCDDGVLNGGESGESDIDCGGTGCPGCDTDQACREDGDCMSSQCVATMCVEANCTDAILNGAETDLDCGGPDCPGCGEGQMCDGPTDCAGGGCDAGVCSSACDDTVLNGTETDVDCGGDVCLACLTGQICLAATDCESGVCGTDGLCVAPACDDLIANGTETDVDCGGPDCGTPCADGLMCLDPTTDCASGACEAGVCVSCSDGILNQDEREIDCGGVCGGCPDGIGCGAGTDCISGVCTGGTCTSSGSYDFTTCAATTAQMGPTQAMCDDVYGGGGVMPPTSLAGIVTVAGGIQRWVVPRDGTYRIDTYGAQGRSAEPAFVGGRGARMRGDFVLSAGQELAIIVGQSGRDDGCNGGGGGGSFVVDIATMSPLIIAGGGGGTRSSAMQNGCPGRVTAEGGTGSAGMPTHSCGARTGGAGDGGMVSGSSWGSAGGGMNTNGATDGGSGGGGLAFVNGGTGGRGPAFGGFGGGGSGHGSCGGGGGGGYSGGDGGHIAGGAGSINTGTLQANIPGRNLGDGSIAINRL